jgi:uncharacterized membrane protein
LVALRFSLIPGLMLFVTGISVAEDADVAFFEQKIRPVLVERCSACHSAKAAQAGKLKGGLQLDTRAGLLAGATRDRLWCPAMRKTAC